jgi:hypothetical protein
MVARVRISRIWCRTCGRYFPPGLPQVARHLELRHDVIAEGSPYP